MTTQGHGNQEGDTLVTQKRKYLYKASDLYLKTNVIESTNQPTNPKIASNEKSRKDLGIYDQHLDFYRASFKSHQITC